MTPDRVPGDLRREASAPGFRVELIRIIGKRRVQFKHSGEAFLGLMNVLHSDGETFLAGAKSTLKDLRGRVTVVPLNMALTGWATFQSQRSSYLNVYLDPASGNFRSFDIAKLQPALHIHNGRLATTLSKYKEAMIEGDCHDVAYMETIGLLLVQELFKMKSSMLAHRNSSGLTPAQLSRIRDYIAANIGGRITIIDLAVLIGVSRFHLIRVFGEAVGMPPYQYILMERVKAAKELLRGKDMRIEAVARAVGFNDPVQLNRAFRKFAKVTPTEFRKR